MKHIFYISVVLLLCTNFISVASKTTRPDFTPAENELRMAYYFLFSSYAVQTGMGSCASHGAEVISKVIGILLSRGNPDPITGTLSDWLKAFPRNWRCWCKTQYYVTYCTLLDGVLVIMVDDKVWCHYGFPVSCDRSQCCSRPFRMDGSTPPEWMEVSCP